MVLKFILILLGIVLGLLLLLILLLLFCPVRYRAEIGKESEDWKAIQAQVSVSWLFRLISFKIWIQDGQLQKRIRILGIPVLELLAFLKNHKHGRKTLEQPMETRRENSMDPEEEKIQEGVSGREDISGKSEIPEIPEAEVTFEAETVIEEESRLESEKITEETSSDKKNADEIPLRTAHILEKLGNKLRHILEILKGIPDRYKYAREHIKETKNQLEHRLRWWKKFLGHPRTKAAMSLAKEEIIRLIRHICPTRVGGEVTFGCEDPAVTGQVLMILGITVPCHKNTIQVNPLFDGQNHLTGHVRMKGRLYGFVFVFTSFKIYFNKNIRFVIHRWKKKEG
jgi:hypothetical protein